MNAGWERAVRRGDVQAVREMLGGGADVNARDRHGQTALMLAIVAGRPGMARILARAGADLGVRGVGAPGFAGKNAYDLAVARNMTDLYEDLSPA
jgi:ankyrin repeat protein